MPRAPFRRVRSLTDITLAFAFLALGGCAQAVRPVDSAPQSGAAGTAAFPAEIGGPDRASIPRPPDAGSPPPYDAIERLKLENGPNLCAAKRPDLAQSFVSLELGRHLLPEEALLLREWIRAAWIQELGGEVVTFWPPACDQHFLCLSGPADRAEFLVGALLRVLSAPSQNAFYQTRVAALKSAEEWDRRSADWKLNTAARALRTLSLSPARPEHQQKADNSALPSLVARQSGAAKAASLPLLDLEKQLVLSLRTSAVVVASPSFGALDLNRLTGQWRAKPGKTEPTPGRVPAPESPLRLEKDAPDVTQAALLWELPENSALGPVETALSLVALRTEGRAGETARVRVQPAGGLYSLPALRVDGPHEQVLATLSALSEEYDRLISTYGAPTEGQWGAAKLRRPAQEHFEPRCSDEGPKSADATAMERSREALRAAGTPTVVVWGTDSPPPPSE